MKNTFWLLIILCLSACTGRLTDHLPEQAESYSIRKPNNTFTKGKDYLRIDSFLCRGIPFATDPEARTRLYEYRGAIASVLLSPYVSTKILSRGMATWNFLIIIWEMLPIRYKNRLLCLNLPLQTSISLIKRQPKVPSSGYTTIFWAGWKSAIPSILSVPAISCRIWNRPI